MLALCGAPAHAQRPSPGEDDSAALVSEGRDALKRGALGQAAKALDEAIALNPRRVEAYVLRSAVYAAHKDYRPGIALLSRARVLAPADEDVLTQLGSQLVLSGDPAAGVPLLEQVVAGDPARAGAQLLLGLHWHAAGQWERAIAALEAYFTHRPRELANEDGRHRVSLADAYLRTGQPARALTELETAVRAAPPDLRTRLAIAWATAALDCRRARELLGELEPVAVAHPEIWLVDGRCALMLGDTAAAVDRGRRYLEHADKDAAAGHALIGEAEAVRGELVLARRELEAARALEPGRRAWTVRLAAVTRRAGDAHGAAAMLDQLGAPAPADTDLAWWLELGEALVAGGEPVLAAARLAPIVAQLPGDAALRTVLGAAQLAAGQTDLAIATLEVAEALATRPRSRQLLARALTIAAAGSLAAGDAAAAEAQLVRADQLDESAVVLRDLGIARLIQGRPREAQAALDRAIRLDGAPITVMLDARAHALAGDLARARPLYQRALDQAHGAPPGSGDIAIEVALDWAASELAGGELMIAVAALERIAPGVGSGPLARRHRTALAEVRHAAGVAALGAGNATRAVELLEASAATEPALATSCDLALAAAVAGDAATALAAAAAVGSEAARTAPVPRCPFPPPADVQAVPILAAFAGGLDPQRAGSAFDRLTALAAKASGPAKQLVASAIRVVAVEAAAEAYRRGRIAATRRYLVAARSDAGGAGDAREAQLGGDELAYDLALLDVTEAVAGPKLDAAIAQLERLAPRLPEALVTLGLAYERSGQPRKALEAWLRARKAGVRFAPLAAWIDWKQRMYPP